MTSTASGWADAAEVPGGLRLYAHAQCPGDPRHGYLVGGMDIPRDPNPKLFRYDAQEDVWEEMAPPPVEPGPNPAAVCGAGEIHVLGGDGTDRHLVYDVGQDSWRTAAPLPQALSEAAAGFWNGKVYLAGGAADGGWYDTLDRVDVYDVATDSWSAGEPMPVATKSPGYAQVGPYLYVVGGMDRNADPEVLDAVQRLDMRSGEWTLGPALAQARSSVAVSATDTALYAVGGLDQRSFGEVPSPTVQRLPLADFEEGGPWSTDAVAELPMSRAYGSAGFCTQGRTGGEIWSVGGSGGAERTLFHPVAGEECPGLATDVPWLEVPQGAGTVPAGEFQQVQVRVDATQLDAGETYTATLLVDTTDPARGQIRVPVTVRVR